MGILESMLDSGWVKTQIMTHPFEFWTWTAAVCATAAVFAFGIGMGVAGRRHKSEIERLRSEVRRLEDVRDKKVCKVARKEAKHAVRKGIDLTDEDMDDIFSDDS